MSRNSNASGRGYDKHMEHSDQTPLGKLQQQYWTTKQQVIKKLGKKEDEYVVMSDAELDAKLDLFEAIEINSTDLLRIIEMYQEKLITLSIEEGEMSRFLKSQSTYDTKTKAGKMMAAVAKAQHFASQQRTTLRLPLVRLYNEVETFRNRAIVDTYMTIRKMENARTEYRGALLWMRNISLELDPDTTKKLEKYRRVQAQVKKTKTKFDRLKTDVIQKIDLLSASRCNMYSNVLVNYQQTLIVFWEKSARTMNAVAEAYKGYQYYEFNIIKDLVEPSKRLANMASSSTSQHKQQQQQQATKKKEPDNSKNDDENENDEEYQDAKSELEKIVNGVTSVDDSENNLINIGAEATLQAANSSTLIDFDEVDNKVDQVNELIDLMTLNQASALSEQLKELEQLEMEKKQRTMHHSKQATTRKPETTGATASGSGAASSFFNFGALTSSLLPQSHKAATTTATNSSGNSASASAAAAAASRVATDVSSTDHAAAALAASTNPNNANLKSLNEMFNNASDEFEREWQSAFTSPVTSTSPAASTGNLESLGGGADNADNESLSPLQSEFGFFTSATPLDSNATATAASSLTDVNSLFPSQLMSSSRTSGGGVGNIPSKQHTGSSIASNASSKAASSASGGTVRDNSGAKNLSAWYDLFAELDPLKNPDSIGQKEGIEEERNC